MTNIFSIVSAVRMAADSDELDRALESAKSCRLFSVVLSEIRIFKFILKKKQRSNYYRMNFHLKVDLLSTWTVSTSELSPCLLLDLAVFLESPAELSPSRWDSLAHSSSVGERARLGPASTAPIFLRNTFSLRPNCLRICYLWACSTKTWDIRFQRHRNSFNTKNMKFIFT